MFCAVYGFAPASERRISPRMMKTRKESKKGVEWIAGCMLSPTEVPGHDGILFRPHVLMWAMSDGRMLGATLLDPAVSSSEQIVDHFYDVTENPEIGQPHIPSRIRVNSQDLVKTLSDALDESIEVVCGPTPELDAFIEGMAGHLNEMSMGPSDMSYLDGDVTPAVVGSFFEAAAKLYKAAPWKHFPDDEDVLMIDIPAYNVSDAVVSVIGQLDESLGFIVFPDVDAFEMFQEAASYMGEGEEPQLPPHMAVDFDKSENFGADVRQEIADHKWVVANEAAYPNVLCVDENLSLRERTPQDFAFAECLCLAIADLVKNVSNIEEMFMEGDAFQHAAIVHVAGKKVEVKMRAGDL